MNKTLDDAMLDIEKAKAVMYAYEKTYLDLEVAPEEREKADLAISMFYVLRDIIDELADKLELLSGDCRVVDAIYAVNDVRRRDGTLKTED